jgi:hypothetical protein
MYLIRSRNLIFNLRLVWPTYAFWQVLHLILYIPLFSYSDFWVWVFGFIRCCIVAVALNAMPMFVFLNKLVTFLTCGLWYVNVVQIFLRLSFFFECSFLFLIWRLSFSIVCCGWCNYLYYEIKHMCIKLVINWLISWYTVREI